MTTPSGPRRRSARQPPLPVRPPADLHAARRTQSFDFLTTACNFATLSNGEAPLNRASKSWTTSKTSGIPNAWLYTSKQAVMKSRLTLSDDSAIAAFSFHKSAISFRVIPGLRACFLFLNKTIS